MQKHKWYNEIVAWAAGAEIEYNLNKRVYPIHTSEWVDMPKGDFINLFDDKELVFRIKPQPVEPQPKEPQYLYVYADDYWFANVKLKTREQIFNGEFGEYLGKIPLIVESNDND